MPKTQNVVFKGAHGKIGSSSLTSSSENEKKKKMNRSMEPGLNLMPDITVVPGIGISECGTGLGVTNQCLRSQRNQPKQAKGNTHCLALDVK